MSDLLTVYRDAAGAYAELVLCAAHGAALIALEAAPLWILRDGDSTMTCDACAARGLDYAHLRAWARGGRVDPRPHAREPLPTTVEELARWIEGSRGAVTSAATLRTRIEALLQAAHGPVTVHCECGPLEVWHVGDGKQICVGKHDCPKADRAVPPAEPEPAKLVWIDRAGRPSGAWGAWAERRIAQLETALRAREEKD